MELLTKKFHFGRVFCKFVVKPDFLLTTKSTKPFDLLTFYNARRSYFVEMMGSGTSCPDALPRTRSIALTIAL